MKTPWEPFFLMGVLNNININTVGWIIFVLVIIDCPIGKREKVF